MRINLKNQLGSITLSMTPERRSNRFSKEKYFRLKQSSIDFMGNSERVIRTDVIPPIYINKLSEKMNEFKYLPLELFEDTTYNKLSNQELFLKIEHDGPIQAQILTENNHEYQFVLGEIIDYNFVKETFRYTQHGVTGTCGRIYFICNFEDPIQYTNKLLKAFDEREMLDSQLRYNFYIENMPTRDVNGMPHWQEIKIRLLIKQKVSLKEVRMLYKRVQNKLQFDYYLENQKDKITNLKLDKLSSKLLKNKGVNKIKQSLKLNLDKIQVIEKGESQFYLFNFKAIRQQILDLTIFNQKDIIKAMQAIVTINEEMLNLQFFYYQEQPYLVDTLKQKQESLLGSTIKTLKEWSPRICSILKTLQIPQMKKLIYIIRMKQQEMLTNILSRSVFNFKEYLQERVPLQIRILNASQVSNSKKPIFFVSIIYNLGFKYTYQIKDLEIDLGNQIQILFQESSYIRDPESILYDFKDVPRFLKCPVLNEIEYNEIIGLLRLVQQQMLEYLRQYASFKHIFEMELEQFVRQCKIDDFDEIKFKDLIYEVIQTQNHIRFQIPQTITVSIFIVENHVLLHQIGSKLDNLIKEMIAYLVSYAHLLLEQVVKEFEELQLKIQEFPKNIEEVEGQKLFLNEQIVPILEEKQKSIERITGLYEILDEFNFIFKSEDLKLRWNVLSYPYLIQNLIQKQSELLIQRKTELKQQFQGDLQCFKNHIEHLDKIVGQFAMKQQDAFLQLELEAIGLKNELNETKERGKVLNQRELLFELPISNFNRIEHILLQFSPLEKLWGIVSYWKCNNQNWINDQIDKLNFQEINTFVLNSINQLENVNKFALNHKMQNILQIGQNILGEIKEFKLQLPLLQSLTEPGMKQRHWELLLKNGQNIQNKSFLEMQDIVQDHQLCIKIGLQAKEELQIESELQQIQKEYQQLIIKKDENSYINLDQLLNNLDDQLFNIGIMQQNKNNIPFQEQLNILEQQLLQSLEYVEQLNIFQINYQELFPIFQQSDLLKQLPMEVNKFKFLEKYQIKLLQQKEQRLFRCQNPQLNEQNTKLIQLQKSLANYLDKKRDIFHRLYFLSNQMLLQLNSQKNPKNYIPHIFHFQITLNEDYIVEIYTSQSQLSITPVNYKSTQPEDYLPQLLEQMQRSLQKYQSVQMKEIQDLVEFTHLMDQSFPKKPNTHQSLYQYLQLYPQDSFEWQRQFKYYMNQNNLIEIKILEHVFNYDYEFQEFKPLNELTTQNDRYFIHFAFAFTNHFGCAVYGNSGKTETIHQFSSLLGKYHITLSIINYQLLPQIIKGVSGSGSHCILRNIDLLDKEIISIMIAQLSYLYQAKSHNLDCFDFDGQIIKLVPTFQFFVTQKHSKFENTSIRNIFRIIALTSTIDETKIQNDLLRRFLNVSDISLNARQIQNLLKEIKLFGVNIAIRNLNQPEEIMDYLGIGGVKITIEQILESRKTMILIGDIGKTELLKQMYSKSCHFYLDALPNPYYFGTFENEGFLQKILQKTQSKIIILETKDIEPFIDIESINFPNGFKFQLQDRKIIFEMITLKHISPSTILRVGLYNHQIELDIPTEGQPFINLVDHFPSPITKKHQILTFLKLLSLKIAPPAQCAIWAFASHLHTDTRILMQRQISELNQFKEAILEIEFQPVLLQRMNILYLGSTASGKTHKLNQYRDVFKAHLNVQSTQLLAYCSNKLVKKRKGIYSIGMIQIDDIHLIQQSDFLRQLLDRQGWEEVQLLDFQMIVTSQTILHQRMGRHFLTYLCEQASLQSIFNPIQTQLFDQMKQFFVPTPKKPHYRISIHDIMQPNTNQLYFYHRIDDEQDRKLFQQKYQIKFTENTDYIDIFKKNQLIYFDELGQIMDYLLKILRQQNFKIILYGPYGYGKKTILNLALKIAQLNTKIHEDPSLELLSELLIKDQVICIYDQDGVKNITSKSQFLSKFSIIYVPKWPLDAYQQIETYNFDVSYNLYCHLQQLSKNINPSKYVQFTRQLSQFIVQRNAQLARDITKLQGGLTLLYSAQLAVNQINMNLNEMKPNLESSAIETKLLVEELQQERIIADQKREQILRDESVAEQEQLVASQLSKESQAKVEKVKGDLEITLLEVQKLRKEHLVEIKSLISPPKAVRVILGGVVILLSESIKMDMKNEDYLELAKKHLLNDTKELLDLLQNYNRDNIPHQVITRLEMKILSDSDFSLERARQCCHAVKFLYSWVKGMYDYNKVYVETQPVRDALKERQQILNELTCVLNQKKQELMEIEMKLSDCQERLEKHHQRREQLENQIEECSLMSKRSQRLIEGFKEEQRRWTHDIYLRKGNETRNLGDGIICCSMLCWGGELDSTQRQELYQYMWNYLQRANLKYSEKCTLCSYLNLSEDTFQKENQKIIEYRQPQQLCIFIDPQLQGIKLFDLKVIRSNQGKLIQQYIKQRQLICVDISDQYPEEWDNRVYYMTQFGVSNIQNKVAVHSCIVNFTISQRDLEERILKTLIEIESPSLELKRLHNIQILEQDQLTLIKVEQQILNLLANQANVEILLKDEVLVRELQNSKHIYLETNNKIEITKQLNNEIFVYREQYRQLSEYLALIYKLIYQFSKKNRYYQYSLDHFVQLLKLLNFKGSNQISLNIQSIKQTFTSLILTNQLQYLYTKSHYFLFCFTLSIELLMKKKIINPEEYKVFTTKSDSPPIGNPTIYISDYMWAQIVRRIVSIQKLPIFQNILTELAVTPSKFKQFYLNEVFPTEYSELTSFQQILLINAFRPDLTKRYIIKLIENTLQMQWEFSKYQPNLDDKIPILIVDNQDPLFQNAISLGIGQNQKAEKIMQEASSSVISNPIELLNCQFGEQFINSIDINQLNFKLILHVENSTTFPNHWIVGSQKVRIHEADTIVQNLRNSIDQVVNPNLFFSLNLFHAICQLRFKFNLQNYRFSPQDLQLALTVKTPFLRELIYECQISCKLTQMFFKTINSSSIKEGYIYTGGQLKMIKSPNKEGYYRYLEDLGQISDFLACGISFNQWIVIQNEQNAQFLSELVNYQIPNNIEETMERIERYLPLPLKDCCQNVSYKVEMKKFNILINQISQDLGKLKLYLQGQCVCEIIVEELMQGSIPKQWREYSFQIKKDQSIGGWILELFERVQFFNKFDSVKCYNLSAFYQPKLFLRLIQGQYLQFNYSNQHFLEIEEKPKEGVYLYGIKIVGAKYVEMSRQFKLLPNFEFESDLPLLLIEDGPQQLYDYDCNLFQGDQIIFILKLNGNNLEEVHAYL